MDPGSVVFSRYLLLEQIGAGGTGVVWKATDQLLHQPVALKRVPFAGLDDKQIQLTRERGLREARLAAQLRGHPHVVTVYDVLADDSNIWLVMEYLPARSLSELARTQGRLLPADAETTRDLLTRLVSQLDGATDHASARTARHWSRWWRKPTRRVMVIAAVLITAVTAITGIIELRTSRTPPLGLPTSPVPGDPRADPRNADPCSLINLDSLRRFGEPRPVVPPLLQSCQVDINPATSDDSVELQIVLQNPTPVSKLDGIPDLNSDPPIVRSSSVQYWGAKRACRSYLVPALGQPVIAIYVLTYGDNLVDLCAMVEAATTTAIEALKRNGGIAYSSDRTSVYSHASSDACAILNRTALEMVPALNLDNQLPGFAD
ncbi:MAG: protein kinase domain-containing protein [Pseudonocardiaceae bacterium]